MSSKGVVGNIDLSGGDFYLKTVYPKYWENAKSEVMISCQGYDVWQ